MFKIILSTITTILILTITTIQIPNVSADTSDDIGKGKNSSAAAEENPLREKCYKCHANDPEYKEWKTSAHAKSLADLKKSPRASNSCLLCHSAGHSSDVLRWGSSWSSRVTLENAQNDVACSSCHRHGATKKHYLIKPVENLCESCHKMDCG